MNEIKDKGLTTEESALLAITIEEDFLLKSALIDTDTLLVIQEALEKQIPKKALEIKDRHDFAGKVIFKDGYCPVCKNEMSSAYFFCNRCGQAIDWSVEE